MSHGQNWRQSWDTMNNVRYEYELYEPMCNWLKSTLEDKYKRHHFEIIVVDSHSVSLDTVLEEYGVIDQFPQIVGLQIQIDVLGIVKSSRNTELYFIEAKKTVLNLHDLGQLWAYCKLCDPTEAYLLSSAGLGSLDTILKNFQREDMLDYGNGKTIKKMKVAKWDINRSSIDYHTIVPVI